MVAGARNQGPITPSRLPGNIIELVIRFSGSDDGLPSLSQTEIVTFIRRKVGGGLRERS